MRLKFLFFPIMLVVSLSLFIGYIWPEIGDLKAANAEKMNNKNALEAINQKRAAVEKINSQIDQDIESEMIVNSYLPSAKTEERILSSINFLASDSGVSLVNISLKDSAQQSDVSSSGLPASVGGVVPVPAMPTPMGGSAIANSAAAQPSNMQGTEATILISGDYDKIKLFIDQVQHLSLYNSIKSFTISSQAAAATNADSKVDSNILSANILVSFGYVNTVKMESERISRFNPNIDNSISVALKQYISKKSPSVESLGDKGGKENPFVQ